MSPTTATLLTLGVVAFGCLAVLLSFARIEFKFTCHKCRRTVDRWVLRCPFCSTDTTNKGEPNED